MKNWKTTAAGIAAIIAAVAQGLAATLDGDPATVADWATIVPLVLGALGLIVAKDAVSKDDKPA